MSRWSARGGTLPPLALILALGGCASAPPQVPVAVAPTAPTVRAVTGGVYTRRQALRGERSFERICAACHRTREFSGSAFQRVWGGRSVGDLFQLLVETMPPDAPGSLDPREYTDVVTYLLQLNGYPAGEEELPADLPSLRDVRFGV